MNRREFLTAAAGAAIMPAVARAASPARPRYRSRADKLNIALWKWHRAAPCSSPSLR